MSVMNNSRSQIDVTPGKAIRTTIYQEPGETLNVTVGAGGTVVNIYNDISNIAQSVTTSLLSYVVPIANTFAFNMASVSGTNIAKFTVKIDGVTQEVRRTYFTQYNETFQFEELKLVAGQTVLIEVIHERPMLGDFEAKIIGSLT